MTGGKRYPSIYVFFVISMRVEYVQVSFANYS